MEKSKKMLMADLGLLITAFIWGSGFIAQKSSLEALGPYYQMAVRFTLSTVLMGIVFFKRVKQIKKSDLKAGLLIGFILFAAYGLQTVALQSTEVGSSAFITASNVVMVPFLYWIVKKQRPDGYHVAAAILCTIGIGMISLKNGLAVGRGEFLTLLCAVGFACHILVVGLLSKEHDPIVLTIVQLGFAAIFSIVTAVPLEPFPFPIASGDLFGVVYLALFSTLICYLLQNVCQKYTTPSHAAVLLCLESVFGTLMSIFLLGETFTGMTVAGFIIVFIAVLTAETKWSFLRKPQMKPVRDEV